MIAASSGELNYPWSVAHRPKSYQADDMRKSQMDIGKTYFWTSTIKDWKHLLKPDKYKQLLVDILKGLVTKNLVVVYGFVWMPNHIHIIWKMNRKNGREKPYASFNKATAHLIIKDLKANHPKVLPYFKVEDSEREYRVWQRDALAVPILSREMLEQKLEYIHLNPLQEKWQLAEYPEEYRWSSVKFYESEIDDFGFLTHYKDNW